MLHLISDTFKQHTSKIAFSIAGKHYSYEVFLKHISGIRALLRKEKPSSHFVGLAGNDDIETYASILAVWAEGYAFVPLSSQSPSIRNTEVLQQVDSTLLLSSISDTSSIIEDSNVKILYTEGLQADEGIPDYTHLAADEIRCMLFTSGSTGIPKGVPYTTQNINSTLDAFFAQDIQLTQEDRFLQMFELTFDMSMLSYLPAWCIGASVHTVNKEGVKYLNAFKVLSQEAITFAAMVPSTLQLLRPYFSQIKLLDLRYNFVGGEPFYCDLAEEWMPCVPNAQVVNISGPCETTMACMGYTLSHNFNQNKAKNNILAFGKPWKNTTVLLLKEDDTIAKIGEEGELCFGGKHVMNGYWQMPKKNELVFFEREIVGQKIKFYRSGDMAFRDEAGVYYSTGRKDIQYKIQGYKVELGDIERHAQMFLGKGIAAAIVEKNEKELLEIHLFIDQEDIEILELQNYLKGKLPAYMWPRTIKVLKKFPLTTSGKINRPQLSLIFKEDDFDWITDFEMGNRIAENLYELYNTTAKYMNVEVWKEESLSAVNNHRTSWPKTLFGKPSLDQIPEIVDEIKTGKLPPRLVLQRPPSPDQLYEKMSSCGFRHMVAWPGMAINVEGLKKVDTTQFNIQRITAEKMLKDWVVLVNAIHFKNDPLSFMAMKDLLAVDQIVFYGLYEKGELMSAAMGFVHGKGMGVYMVATSEEHRRKGFGKALTLYLLEDAKKRNCKAVYLQASKEGERMYQKIGFQTFNQFDIFWLLGIR